MGAVRPIVVTNTLNSDYNNVYPGFQLRLGHDTVSYFGLGLWGTLEFNRLNIRTGTPSSMSNYPYSPTIFAFWAEVSDQTPPTYGTATIDGRAAFVVNWTNVRHQLSASSSPLTNTFQIVVYGQPSNVVHFEMNYDQIQWEIGNTGTFPPGAEMVPGELAPALAGYRLSPKIHWRKSGSLEPGGLLDSNLDTGLIHNSLNSDVPGRYVYSMTMGQIDSNQEDASADSGGKRRWFARQGAS